MSTLNKQCPEHSTCEAANKTDESINEAIFLLRGYSRGKTGDTFFLTQHGCIVTSGSSFQPAEETRTPEQFYPPFDYCRDIRCAWDLVEELERENVRALISNEAGHIPNRWACELGTFGCGDADAFASADGVARAIAEAYLAYRNQKNT